MPQVLPLEADFYFKGLFSKRSNHFSFCKWEFWCFDLLMAIFRLFGEVFCYISFVNSKRVCRMNQTWQKLKIWHTLLFYYFLSTVIVFFYKLGPLSCNGPLNSRSQNLQETRIIGTFLFQLLSLRAVHCSSTGLCF